MQKQEKSFAFLAHRVETWNYLLPMKNERRFLRWFNGLLWLHVYPERASEWRWLSPLYMFMSVVYFFSRRPYDVVDYFRFRGLFGQTCLIRNFGWHFFLPFKKMQRARIKKRILQSVLDIQDGVGVIGIGALIKDEALTQGGEWIVKELGDKLKVPLVHGDTLTAATVVNNVLAVGERKPVVITGATSKIGRAVTLTLARLGYEVYMHTRDKERFLAIYNEAGDYKQNIFFLPRLDKFNACASLWITGKAVPAGEKLLRHIPAGSTVINFAVPDPIADKLKEKYREKYDFVDGGLLYYDKRQTSFYGSPDGLTFTMRLRPGATYPCHVSTMVYAYKGWKPNEVGPVDIEKMPLFWQASTELGFFLKPTLR